MAIKPITLIERAIYLPVKASTTINENSAVAISGGYAIEVVAATEYGPGAVKGIAVAKADNSSGGDGAIDVLVVVPSPSQEFEADASADTAQTDVGTVITFGAATVTVATLATAGKIGFAPNKVIGAVSDRKYKGIFITA